MKIIVDGLATEYTENGSGPSIVLLHGWGSSADVFVDLITNLAQKHRVFAINLPGFGGSEQPKTVWGIKDYAYFVAAFCKKFGLRPEAILGHSLGGQIAVHIVGNELLDPDKLILIGAAALRPKLSAKKRSIKFLAKTGKSILGKSALGEAAKKRLYGSIGSSEYLDSPAMQPIYRRVITEDQSEAAERIDCQTLLLWGASDTDTPLDHGKKLASLITRSELKVNPGGHFIFLDAANDVNAAIMEFLN